MRTAVQVESQAEWDQVINFGVAGGQTDYYNGWGDYKEICINVTPNYGYGYSSKDYYVDNGYTVITFDAWLHATGKTREVDTEEVKMIVPKKPKIRY